MISFACWSYCVKSIISEYTIIYNIYYYYIVSLLLCLLSSSTMADRQRNRQRNNAQNDGGNNQANNGNDGNNQVPPQVANNGGNNVVNPIPNPNGDGNNGGGNGNNGDGGNNGAGNGLNPVPAAPVQLYVPNVANAVYNTAEGWDMAIPMRTIAQNLVIANTSIPWVRQPSLYHAITVYAYASIRMTLSQVRTPGSVTSYFILETLLDTTTDNIKLAAALADARVVEDARACLPVNNIAVQNQMLQAVVGNIPAAERGTLTNMTDFTVNTDVGRVGVITNAADAWAFFQALGRVMFGDEPNVQATLTSAFCMFVMSVAKMGTVSDEKLTKVADRLRNETNIPVSARMWTPEAATTIWTNIQEFITNVNMRAIIQRWIGDGGADRGVIPQHALSLRTLITQIKGEGLTMMSIIKEAMTSFGNFPWGRIAMLFPGEVTAFITACNYVNDDPYYGFIHDNHHVRGGQFKNLGWVSREILMRLGGKTSLGRYRGLPRNPQQDRLVRAIIDEFINNAQAPEADANAIAIVALAKQAATNAHGIPNN